MPSARRQVNVRLKPESEALLAALVQQMTAELGIDVSQSDVLSAGLVELRRKYLPRWSYQPEPEARPTCSEGQDKATRPAPAPKKQRSRTQTPKA